MKDYYEILGVTPDATQAQVREQYRFLLLAWHPDRFPTPAQKEKAEEKAKEINEAYEVLRDPARRARYDEELAFSTSWPRNGAEERESSTHETEGHHRDKQGARPRTQSTAEHQRARAEQWPETQQGTKRHDLTQKRNKLPMIIGTAAGLGLLALYALNIASQTRGANGISIPPAPASPYYNDPRDEDHDNWTADNCPGVYGLHNGCPQPGDPPPPGSATPIPGTPLDGSSNTPSSKLRCIQPPDGLISWWPGDGNANDIIGLNNGELVGGVAFTAGKVDQAFSFNGIDGILVAPAIGLPTGRDPRTVAFWSKINPLDDTTTGFAYSTAADGKGFYVFPSHGENGGRLTFSGHGTSYDVFAPTDLRDGLYHHVAVTYDGAIVTVYADGVSVGSGSFDLDTGISAGTSIGAYSGYPAQSLTGEVDEVAIWNRALSASEVQAMFSEGSAGMCKQR